MSEYKGASATTITDWWSQYQERKESTTSHHLNVFVRSFRPPLGVHGQRKRIFSKVRHANNRGRIDGFDIYVTGEGFCLCDQCAEVAEENTLREAVLQLDRWTEEGLEPTGFERREVNSSLTDESYQVLVPPEIAFGIYLDGTLAGVFPCLTDDSRYGIESYLHCLLTDQAPADCSQRDGQTRYLRS
jgi:hypothetical protein